MSLFGSCVVGRCNLMPQHIYLGANDRDGVLAFYWSIMTRWGNLIHHSPHIVIVIVIYCLIYLLREVHLFLYSWCKVNPPIANTHRKTNTMYQMDTFGSTKCMHVVHSIGFAMGVGDGWVYLNHGQYMLHMVQWTWRSDRYLKVDRLSLGFSRVENEDFGNVFNRSTGIVLHDGVVCRVKPMKPWVYFHIVSLWESMKCHPSFHSSQIINHKKRCWAIKHCFLVGSSRMLDEVAALHRSEPRFRTTGLMHIPFLNSTILSDVERWEDRGPEIAPYFWNRPPNTLSQWVVNRKYLKGGTHLWVCPPLRNFTNNLDITHLDKETLKDCQHVID